MTSTVQIATGNVLLRPEEYAIIIKYMQELLSTTYASYFNWKDSQIKLFFLQSFVEIV